MTRNEEEFDTILSYVLIGGVVASILIEILGISLYYGETGGFNWDYTSVWQLAGPNFFAYAGGLFFALVGGLGPTKIMALGIILLMLTPYLRVIASVLYFGRNQRREVSLLYIIRPKSANPKPGFPLGKVNSLARS